MVQRPWLPKIKRVAFNLSVLQAFKLTLSVTKRDNVRVIWLPYVFQNHLSHYRIFIVELNERHSKSIVYRFDSSV